MSKRNYKITPVEMSFGTTYKVEVWNKYGMKREVYERNVMDASEVVYDYWENEDKEYDKMNSLNRAIRECIEIDRKSGILTGNRDGLD
jgi:hypothetical protein